MVWTKKTKGFYSTPTRTTITSTTTIQNTKGGTRLLFFVLRFSLFNCGSLNWIGYICGALRVLCCWCCFCSTNPDPVIWVGLDLVCCFVVVTVNGCGGALCARVLSSKWQLPSVIILPRCQDNSYQPTPHATHIAPEALPVTLSLVLLFFSSEAKDQTWFHDWNMRILGSFTVLLVGLRCAHSNQLTHSSSTNMIEKRGVWGCLGRKGLPKWEQGNWETGKVKGLNKVYGLAREEWTRRLTRGGRE